ncbi:unnamed protein product, partial [Polarella glacialis]
HLEVLNAQLHARQELHLARTSGNPYAILAAIRAGEKAGLPSKELDAARVAAGGQPEGSGFPGTSPQLQQPPTQPQLQTTSPQLQQPTTQPRVQLQQVSTQPQVQLQQPPTQPKLQGGAYSAQQASSSPGSPPQRRSGLAQRLDNIQPLQPNSDSPISIGAATPFGHSPEKPAQHRGDASLPAMPATMTLSPRVPRGDSISSQVTVVGLLPPPPPAVPETGPARKTVRF